MDNKQFIAKCEERLKEHYKRIDDTAYFNQCKVTEAFLQNRIAARHFAGTTATRAGILSVSSMPTFLKPRRA